MLTLVPQHEHQDCDKWYYTVSVRQRHTTLHVVYNGVYHPTKICFSQVRERLSFTHRFPSVQSWHRLYFYQTDQTGQDSDRPVESLLLIVKKQVKNWFVKYFN